MHPSEKYSRRHRGPLVPCPSCKRHVFAVEDGCPFCAAALPSDLAKSAAPATGQRLSRAELFAFNERRGRALSASELAHATGGVALSQLGLAQDAGSGFQMYGAPSLGDQLSSPSFGTDQNPSQLGWDDPGGGFQMYGSPPADPDPSGPPPGDDGGVGAEYGAPGGDWTGDEPFGGGDGTNEDSDYGGSGDEMG